MYRFLTAAAAAALITGGVVAAPTVDAHPDTPDLCFDEHLTIISPCPPLPDPERCEEDMPCWDPCTMGDRYGYTTEGVWVDCRTELV